MCYDNCTYVCNYIYCEIFREAFRLFVYCHNSSRTVLVHTSYSLMAMAELLVSKERRVSSKRGIGQTLGFWQKSRFFPIKRTNIFGAEEMVYDHGIGKII